MVSADHPARVGGWNFVGRVDKHRFKRPTIIQIPLRDSALTARCKYKEDIVDGSIIEIMEIAILKYKKEDNIFKKADSRNK